MLFTLRDFLEIGRTATDYHTEVIYKMEMSEILTIVVGVLGGGLGVALLSRVFAKSDAKRTDSASVFSRQMDDGASLRTSMLDRIKLLEATIEKLMANAVENERLKARVDDLTEQLNHLREAYNKIV